MERLLYIYSLKGLDDSVRVRFVYAIKGRGSEKGFLMRLKGRFLAPGCFMVDTKRGDKYSKEAHEIRCSDRLSSFLRGTLYLYEGVKRDDKDPSRYAE